MPSFLRISTLLALLIANPHYELAMEGSHSVKKAKVESSATPNACKLYSTISGNNIIGDIVQDMRTAQKGEYIGIESPHISNNLMIQEIKNAALRGVNIRIFTDHHYEESLKQQFAGTNIHVVPMKNIHSKRIVIGSAQPLVWLGSMNLSERSNENIELMLRCTDPQIFKDSYASQQRPDLDQNIPPHAVNFASRTLLRSNNIESISRKIRMINDLSFCNHPDDHLYFVSYTLDDPEIEQALVDAAEKLKRPITLILDVQSWKNQRVRLTLKRLIMAGAHVYIYNKNENEKNNFGGNRFMHIKAILKKCDQNCLSLISTANFTPTGKSDINFDLWEPCSFSFAEQLERIFKEIIPRCVMLNLKSFPAELEIRNKTEHLWELTKYPSRIHENRESIIRLIREGANVNAIQPENGTMLMRAIHADQEDIVRELLETGADVNASVEGVTALHYAAQYGNGEILKMLLAVPGIEINRPNIHRSTPLFYAIGAGKLNAVKLLLAAGADPNLGGGYRIYGRRPQFKGTFPTVLVAAQQRDPEIVEELLKSNADINATDPEGINALIYVSSIAPNVPMIKLLVKRQAIVDITNPKSGKTLLVDAILRNDANTLNILNILLNAGANINFKDNQGKTTLYYVENAIESTRNQPDLQNSFKKMKEVLNTHEFMHNNIELMNYTEPVNSTNVEQTPFIIEAAIQGNLKLVDALIQAGENIHAKDAQGRTALNHVNHARQNTKNNPQSLENYDKIKKLLEDSIYKQENVTPMDQED